ncbi:MAG: M20 family metallopeptidase [Propionibacteriales bacterium]|nr:M20 family metallopeptidase [Propionibacteriales bacterium]
MINSKEIPVPDLLDATTEQREAILADIVALVEVESHSRDRASLDTCRGHVEALAERLLGPSDERTLTPGGEQGDIVQLTFAGTGPGRVLAVSHYDTVWPTGTLADWPVRTVPGEDGGPVRLTGPGIFDMKSGLVQSLWALRVLRDSGRPTPTVTFVFNGDEEIGSIASRTVIEAAARTVDAALVFEASQAGALKTGRKGIGIFTLTTVGVEAHAGLDPLAGASAVHAMAEVITQVTRIADLSAGTSINVGLVSGGSGTNVAAGRATASVDIRVTGPDEMARVDRAFDAITVTDDRVVLTVDHNWNRPPMALDATMQPLLEVVLAAGRELGREIDHTSVGGASDANFIAGVGVPVICGFGAVGHGAHARHEYILPSEIAFQTALAAATLAGLADGLD